MEDRSEHRPPSEPIVELRLPRVYGSFPTLFGAPLAETGEGLRGADVGFLGVPWRAPTTPNSFFVGGASVNFEGTLCTATEYSSFSLRECTTSSATRSSALRTDNNSATCRFYRGWASGAQVA